SKQPWPEGGGGADEKFAVGAEAWDWPSLSGSTKDTFARVRRLVEIDEIDAARDDWDDIRDKVEGSVPSDKRLLFIHFMGQQIEDFNRGWRKVNGNLTMPGQPDADDIEWVLAYPRAYEPLV